MAKYRARAALFVKRLIQAGEEFESDLPPGRNWQPIDAEARAKFELYRAEKGSVLSILDRLDPRPTAPAAVDIDDDWQAMSGPKKRGLAMRLGAPGTVKVVEADSFITAELARRAQQKVA